MKPKGPKTADFKIISLSELAARSNIGKMRLYYFLNDKYRTLSESECNRIANALYTGVVGIFESLGFHLPPPVRLTDQDPADHQKASPRRKKS